ncbi:MAG: alpha/beta fold hydrolase, partial [Planctomycetota bacterium]
EHGAKIPSSSPDLKNQEAKLKTALDVKHHHADLGDVRLHYVTVGEGEPLVLLHGWPQTWYEWRKVIPLLAGNYKIIAPDMRGLGDSSRPEAGYDKLTVADDIWRLMNKHLGHKRFKVVGHDWGSLVAFALALTHPEAVSQLALVEGTVPVTGGPPPDAHTRNISKELNASGKGWHMKFHILPELPVELTKGREEIYLRWFFHNMSHPSHKIDNDAVKEYVRTYSQPGAMRAGFNYYRTWPQDIIQLTQLASKNKLQMPVLSVFGTSPFRQRPDLKWKSHPYIDRLRTVAPNATGVLIEESGHWIPEEQPQMLAKRLIDFFEGTGSAERESSRGTNKQKKVSY